MLEKDQTVQATALEDTVRRKLVVTSTSLRSMRCRLVFSRTAGFGPAIGSCGVETLLVTSRRGDACLHVVGVTSASTASFLQRLARLRGGCCDLLIAKQRRTVLTE